MKKESKVKTNLKSGVTLVTLVITIIVLLILAGITINLTIGEDGIIKRAQQAGKNYVGAAENERWQLGEFTNEMDNIIGGSTNNGIGPYNSEFRNNVIAAIKQQGVETLETDTDEVIIGNIGKIFEERTKIDSEVAAIADNLTQGKQAYVNGVLITGTGKDLEAHGQAQYSQGFVDGQKNATENLEITYTYHEHIGDATNGGGCYTKPITAPTYGSCHHICYEHSNVYCNIHPNGTYSNCGYGGGPRNTGWTCPGDYVHTVQTGTKVTGYSVSCGKTEETIESATIKY